MRKIRQSAGLSARRCWVFERHRDFVHSATRPVPTTLT